MSSGEFERQCSTTPSPSKQIVKIIALEAELNRARSTDIRFIPIKQDKDMRRCKSSLGLPSIKEIDEIQ